MKIGVVATHGFGDNCFNIPLIKAISEKHQQPVMVAVQAQCADAFYNVPWISRIVHTSDMHNGVHDLERQGCNPVYQITQNIKFFEFRESNPQHSLIDTPAETGRQIGLTFDQKPMFLPTSDELKVGEQYQSDKPVIAIESVAKSGQSWADQAAIDMILNKYIDTHRVLWFSNQGAPNHPNVDNLLKYTRREIITLLRHCETFFSVGSGFFCATMSLPEHLQPKRVVCLWIDDLYKYEKRIAELGLHKNIVWVHDHNELSLSIAQ